MGDGVPADGLRLLRLIGDTPDPCGEMSVEEHRYEAVRAVIADGERSYATRDQTRTWSATRRPSSRTLTRSRSALTSTMRPMARRTQATWPRPTL
jgi:hypothetical protein